MPYYVDSDITYGAAVTGAAMNVPAHQANDILFAYVVVNVNTAPTITAGTGWAAFTAETTNTTNAGYWTYKRAASSAEVLSLTTADDFTCAIHCIRDVNTTTAIDVSSQSGSASATSTPSNVAVTTTTADCLILYLMSVGGIAVTQHADPGVHHITSFDTGGATDITATCQGAAWYVQRAAGATPAPAWTCSLSGVYTRATIAFRNVAGGKVPAYVDDVSSPAAVVHPGFNIGTLNNTVVATALTNTAAVNSKTVSYVAAAVQADLGIDPFSNGLSKAAAIAAATVLTGFEITLTGNRNWSTGLILGSFIGATPKMGTFGVGSISQGGYVIRLGSSATAWCAYQVAAKNSVPTLENRSVWAIQPGYTGSSYGTPGTAVNTAAATYLQVLSNQPSFASNAPLSEVYQVFTQIVAGGTTTNPVDTDGMADIGKSFRLPVIQKSGGFGLLSYVPIQIGGGDAVNFQIDAGSLQFPRRYDTARKEIAFHAADNTVGISYAGKTGDVIKHTNSVITSPTSYYWNINAAATSAATWDFTGLVIVNAAVTLRNVMTFDSMTFSSCGSINATDCTITNSIISKPPATSASFTTNSSSNIDYCAINTSTVTAGNWWWSGADPSIFSYCTFTGGGGHAINCTAVGGATVTLTGNQFNGYGANGTTGAAIYFTATTGTITLAIASGGSTPTYKSAGATIIVTNPKTLTLTGLQTGSDIVILAAGTTTELLNIDANNGATYAYMYSATSNVDIGVFKAGYVPFYIRNFSLAATDASLPVAQTADRNYA